jgi:hypothetical protein
MGDETCENQGDQGQTRSVSGFIGNGKMILEGICGEWRYRYTDS